MTRPTPLRGICLVLAAALAAQGCENNLFHVQSGDPGRYEFPDGGAWDGATSDASVVADACVPSEEVCDGVDNDCNGVVDDAPAQVVASDVRHCGACGNLCDLPNAWPMCVGGECQVEICFPGFWDRDASPLNGCEYACSVTNNGLEVCDGEDNDCDGQVDEDFDLDTNPLHCGQCFKACNFFHAEGACV
ncbi:MAG: MopE-related protein, partial [Polyangia bacterium]|nr:MopE-related protein [Polyangia bacterium]